MSTVKANNVQVGQSGTATNNFTLYQPSTPDGTVRLAVGNSGATSADVLTANSSGNVGIGTSSPGQRLELASSGDVTLRLRSSAGTNDAVADITGYSDALQTGGITFSTRNAGTLAERMRITSGGNLLVGTTTNNASGGVIQVSNGITFPATQSASSDANTLDDYEEGTFNAGIAFGGNAVGVTYVSQAGAYVKTGRMVWCSLCIQTSSKGSSTGNFTITGLPFTSSAVNSYFAVASEGLFAMTGASGGAGTANVGFYSEMGGSSTSVTCYFKTAAANAWTNITNADVTNTMNYFLTICYQTST